MLLRNVTPQSCQPKTSPIRIVRFVAESQLRYVFRPNNKDYGVWLRSEMTHMGPAFVKMGQFLSTRSDLFEKEIIQELAKLQDDITPIPTDHILYIINESLGKDWSEVFSNVEEQPLASASIGQVHMATLRKTQQRVVVKVQKPCVARQIQEDITTLRNLNQWLMSLGSPRAIEVESLLKQYERFLSAELDYTQELNHMRTFRKLLQDSLVRIPKVYPALSTREVLTMEYVPSKKVSEINPHETTINAKAVANSLIALFLQMIVVHGIVHCDPHPGNIGIAEDNETIVLYDFGNVIKLSKEFREEINHIVFAVYQKDVDEFVNLLVKLKVLQINDDIDAVDLKVFFRSFFEYLESLDFATLKDSIQNQMLFSPDTGVAAVQIDPDFLSLFRVFSLLDGTCSRLDENFNYISALQPIAQDLLQDPSFFDTRARRDFLKLQSYPKILQGTEQNLLRTKRNVHNLSREVKTTQMFAAVMCFLYQFEHPTVIPIFLGFVLMTWLTSKER